MIARLTPLVFILIWSTGWIVAKLAAPHADPFAFLIVRYVGAAALLAPLAFVLGARWPATWGEWGHALLNGVLLHAVYLGGVWWAVSQGVPAGVSALIAALQPLFTALAAGPLLGERLGPRRWLGVALGFAGVAAVVAPKLAGGATEGLGGLGLPIAANVLGMAAVAAATLHQKRALAGADLRTLAPAQYLGALAVTAPVVWATGGTRIDWTGETLFAMAWSVLVLSIAAIMLMLVMIKRGEVSRVAALIYLVPPTAAVQAYLLFGETLSPLQLAGMALAAVGVGLAAGAASGAPASAEGCIAANVPAGEDAAKRSRPPA
ncbi:EamA family transporter [Methylopila sp. 73B]|uniref:DMT family transporter n=1 Tax=Methylopila sp. 73B TaxID=1120792 RepID=UPI00036196C2|nr:EamA family transporter [Methylopila sp. 73B]